jgi:hypothetical protein
MVVLVGYVMVGIGIVPFAYLNSFTWFFFSGFLIMVVTSVLGFLA